VIPAIHINSTAPFKLHNKDKAYHIEDFDILTTVLSALMWREKNGAIKLYTDKTGYDYYDSLGLLDLWDGGTDTEVVENIPDTINHQIFWAAAKIFALRKESTPVAMIDTDLIIWENIATELASQKLAVLHREEIWEHIYLPSNLLKKPKNYQFDPEWDWKVLPCNMAFAYFADSDFKDYYTNCAIDFMTGNCEKPKERLSQMVFAEQRIISMCAKKMKIPIFHFLNDPYQSDNTRFTHIWGGKDIARDNLRHRKELCDALLKQIEKRFPSYYDKLSDMEIFRQYLNESR